MEILTFLLTSLLVALILVTFAVAGFVAIMLFLSYAAFPLGSGFVWLYGKLAWPFNYFLGAPERWGKILLRIVMVVSVLTLPLYTSDKWTALLTFYFVWAINKQWQDFALLLTKIRSAGDAIPKEYVQAVKGVAVNTAFTPLFLIGGVSWGIIAMLLTLSFVMSAILCGPPTRRVTDDAKALKGLVERALAPAGPSLAPSI